MRYADLATQVLRAKHREAAKVGFTSPTLTYDEMRRVDADADRLNHDVLTNVVQGPFVTGWNDWYMRWKAFFAKRLPGGFFSEIIPKLVNAADSERFKAEVDTWSRELVGWHTQYASQRTPNGDPVPPAIGPAEPPPQPGQPPASTSWWNQYGSFMPWWAWTLAGVGLVGAGYATFRYFANATTRAREGEGFLRQHALQLASGGLAAGDAVRPTVVSVPVRIEG